MKITQGLDGIWRRELLKPWLKPWESKGPGSDAEENIITESLEDETYSKIRIRNGD
jgi:hypothetical protein